MRKLYVTTVEIEMMVVADSESEACEIAAENFDEECRNAMPTGPDFVVTEVTAARPLVATGWDADSIPWGADGDRTVGEYLDEMSAPSSEDG